MRFMLSLIYVLVSILGSTAVGAAGKVALVIGNSQYEHATTLLNPINDARSMADALSNLGFTVILGTDLTFADMGAKIGEFEEVARNADVTFLFYAGHGMTVDGRNYLLPINAKLERESTLQFEAIDSDAILNAMSGPGKTAIALLDACRNNPLSRSFSRSLGTRSAAVGQGLSAPTVSGDGILIGFATAPGNTAEDGDGNNSPFTTAMLKHINSPGLEIQSLMTRVKADVFDATKQEQQPWHNSSLRNEFYLVDGPAPAEAKTNSDASIEVDWNAVKESTSIAALDAFIAAHPESAVFVALAQEQKRRLSEKSDSELLDSLKIPKAPSAKATIKSDVLKQLALDVPKQDEPPAQNRSSGFRWTLQNFFEAGKNANDGNTIFALLGPPNVLLPKPGRNRGKQYPSLNLQHITSAPTLYALLAAEPNLAFSTEASTSCRLDFIERCPFIPAGLVDAMDRAMLEEGMLMSNHSGNYFQINKLAGSGDFIISNSPEFRDGVVAIISAIVTPTGEVKDMMGFDLSKERLDVAAGDPKSHVALTWAAVENDDLYLSFDSNTRCTEGARNFGFLVKMGIENKAVRWVSPYNVSDANFLSVGNTLLSANGGSCVEDFAYQIYKSTGDVGGRFKVPKAIQRMDSGNGHLLMELYEGAAAYRLEQ